MIIQDYCLYSTYTTINFKYLLEISEPTDQRWRWRSANKDSFSDSQLVVWALKWCKARYNFWFKNTVSTDGSTIVRLRLLCFDSCHLHFLWGTLEHTMMSPLVHISPLVRSDADFRVDEVRLNAPRAERRFICSSKRHQRRSAGSSILRLISVVEVSLQSIYKSKNQHYWLHQSINKDLICNYSDNWSVKSFLN